MSDDLCNIKDSIILIILLNIGYIVVWDPHIYYPIPWPVKKYLTILKS